MPVRQLGSTIDTPAAEVGSPDPVTSKRYTTHQTLNFNSARPRPRSNTAPELELRNRATQGTQTEASDMPLARDVHDEAAQLVRADPLTSRRRLDSDASRWSVPSHPLAGSISSLNRLHSDHFGTATASTSSLRNVSIPVEHNPNHFDMIKSSVFDSSLSEDAAFHSTALNFVNALNYSDLNKLTDNLPAAKWLAMKNISNISDATDNAARAQAKDLLSKHVNEHAYKWQMKLDQSHWFKQTANAGLLGMGFFGAVAAKDFVLSPEPNRDRTINAAATTAALACGLLYRVPKVIEDIFSAKTKQNDIKLAKLNIIVQQRKAGVDTLDGIHTELKKEGVIDENNSRILSATSKDMKTIIDIFENYIPSESFKLSNAEGCSGELHLRNGKTHRIDAHLSNVLSKIKNFGVAHVMQEEHDKQVSAVIPPSLQPKHVSIQPQLSTIEDRAEALETDDNV